VKGSLPRTFCFRQRGFQGQSDGERGAGSVAALQRAAQHFDAFAHAAQSIALGAGDAAAIVLNFEAAVAVLLLETHAAGVGVGVTHHVSDGFAHGQGKNALLHGGNFHGGGGIALHGEAGGFERGLGLGEFGGEPLTAVSADRVADVGERLAGDLLDFADLFSGALRIALQYRADPFSLFSLTFRYFFWGAL